jgi:hypothetical protein
MNTFDKDMEKTINASMRAQELYGLSMQVFTANAQRHDFVAAEAERMNLHQLLDDFLDSFMASQKRMQVEVFRRG